MKAITLALLALTACNTQFYSNGIQVETNGFPVDQEFFNQTVLLLEDGVNKKYPELGKFEAEPFFSGVDTTVRYLEPPIGGRYSIYGYAIKNHVTVRGDHCWYHTYITGHELLHVIGTYYLSVSREINNTHQTEQTYILWANENDLPKETTIEHQLLLLSAGLCQIPVNTIGGFIVSGGFLIPPALIAPVTQ